MANLNNDTCELNLNELDNVVAGGGLLNHYVSRYVEALANIFKKIDSVQETIVQNLK